MDWRGHIDQNPGILCGKPVIKGTRISVELILEEMSNGRSIESLLSSYPFLTEEQIRAALAYAGASLASERTIFAEH